MKKRMFLSAVAVTMALTLFTTPVFASTNLGRLHATVGAPGQPGTPTEPSMTEGRDLLRLLIAHARIMYGRTRLSEIQDTDARLTAPRPAPAYEPYVFEDGIIEPDQQTHAQVWGTYGLGADLQDPLTVVGEWNVAPAARTTFGEAIEAAEYALAVAHVEAGQEFTVRIGLDKATGDGAADGFAGMMLQFGFPEALEITDFSHYLSGFTISFAGEDHPDLTDGEPAVAGFREPRDPLRDPDLVPTEYSPRVSNQVDAYSRNYFHAGWAGRNRTNFTSTPISPSNPFGSTVPGGDNAWFEFTGIVRAGTPEGVLPPITVRVLNAVADGTERPTDIDNVPLDLLLPCGEYAWRPIPGAVAPEPTYRTLTGQIGQIRVIAAP